MTTFKPIKRVTFVSQDEAEVLQPSDEMAMLSITDPGIKANLRQGWKNVLRIEFVDGRYTKEEVERAGELFERCYGTYMTKVHVDQIEHFLNCVKQDDNISRLVIHCRHGRTRSTAIAKYAQEYFKFVPDKKIDRFNSFTYYMMKYKEPPVQHAPTHETLGA